MHILWLSHLQLWDYRAYAVTIPVQDTLCWQHMGQEEVNEQPADESIKSRGQNTEKLLLPLKKT